MAICTYVLLRCQPLPSHGNQDAAPGSALPLSGKSQPPMRATHQLRLRRLKTMETLLVGVTTEQSGPLLFRGQPDAGEEPPRHAHHLQGDDRRRLRGDASPGPGAGAGAVDGPKPACDPGVRGSPPRRHPGAGADAVRTAAQNTPSVPLRGPPPPEGGGIGEPLLPRGGAIGEAD